MTVAAWTDSGYARQWSQHDVQRDLLGLPRAIAAEIVAADRPASAIVVDIGSGPGDFLAHMLTRLPESRGVWCDVSTEMRDIAKAELTAFDDRVDYHIADMRSFAHLPATVDVVVTSRATHHLTAGELVDFYRAAADRLAPGGWLVNLDHTALEDRWDSRTRNARKVLLPRKPEQAAHRHEHAAMPTIADHLDALNSANLGDCDVPWRAFVTCLVMARKSTAG